MYSAVVYMNIIYSATFTRRRAEAALLLDVEDLVDLGTTPEPEPGAFKVCSETTKKRKHRASRIAAKDEPSEFRHFPLEFATTV